MSPYRTAITLCLRIWSYCTHTYKQHTNKYSCIYCPQWIYEPKQIYNLTFTMMVLKETMEIMVLSQLIEDSNHPCFTPYSGLFDVLVNLIPPLHDTGFGSIYSMKLELWLSKCLPILIKLISWKHNCFLLPCRSSRDACLALLFRKASACFSECILLKMGTAYLIGLI